MAKFGHGYRLKKKWFSNSYLAHCTDTFGFMFPRIARKNKKKLPYATATINNLKMLGNEMGSKPNVNDTTIPAGYTYLGQFIDHDITLDPFSDINTASTPKEVEQLNNFRTPKLDLDSVYGNGPSVDPFLYVNNTGDPQEDGVKLLIGTNLPSGPGGPRDPGSGTHISRTDFDVPRTSNQTAIIGDPRNNENLFVSQIHHAFLKFHNAVVDSLKGNVPDEELFSEARSIVVNHYQWIVLHDFLKRVALSSEVDDAIANQNFFRRDPFRMPVEFSVAAYRFGHSLVRPFYDFNDNFNSTTGTNDFMKAFEFVRVPHLPVRTNWVVDLNRFFDTGVFPSINFTKSFGTALAPDLQALPGQPSGSFMASLAARNLVRSVALQVPTGQAVAKRLGVSKLTTAELTLNATPAEVNILNANNSELMDKTPLWYYILKESEVRQNGLQLGRVGSIILAETFTRILRDDDDSIMNIGFIPTLARHNSRPVGDFDMTDLLNFAGVLE